MIPTRINLKKRGIYTVLDCPICLNQMESTDYGLFVCVRAREIWRNTFTKVFLEEDFNNSPVDRWMKINDACSM